MIRVSVFFLRGRDWGEQDETLEGNQRVTAVVSVTEYGSGAVATRRRLAFSTLFLLSLTYVGRTTALKKILIHTAVLAAHTSPRVATDRRRKATTEPLELTRLQTIKRSPCFVSYFLVMFVLSAVRARRHEQVLDGQQRLGPGGLLPERRSD